MLSARQLLLMRRACDRAIGIAIAPTGDVALVPDPDFRRRVFGCVSHVGLAFIARWVGRMDKMASVGCPVIVVGGRRARDKPPVRTRDRSTSEHAIEPVIGALEIDRACGNLAMVAGALGSVETDECLGASERIVEPLSVGRD